MSCEWSLEPRSCAEWKRSLQYLSGRACHSRNGEWEGERLQGGSSVGTTVSTQVVVGLTDASPVFPVFGGSRAEAS